MDKLKICKMFNGKNLFRIIFQIILLKFILRNKAHIYIRAGTNTPSDEYDSYREYSVANTIRIANTAWRIRICIREYSDSLNSLAHSIN